MVASSESADFYPAQHEADNKNLQGNGGRLCIGGFRI